MTLFVLTPILLPWTNPSGYIALYKSLFTFGNLRFPFNSFFLDVLDFFKCHFSLLNPLGMARLTSFDLACRAYGGEPTLSLFRSLCSIMLAEDWLTFQKRPGTFVPSIFKCSLGSIPSWNSRFIFVREGLVSERRPGLITSFRHGLGTYSFPFSSKPFDVVICSRLLRYPFTAQTFPKHILYIWLILRRVLLYNILFLLMVMMTLRDFLHFPRNHLAFFSVRPADIPMSVGILMIPATNVFDKELEMAVASLVANNAVGSVDVEVVPVCGSGECSFSCSSTEGYCPFREHFFKREKNYFS
ncbi:hypothetical protein Tco_0684572 [Tanacetum coccineum]